MDEKKFAKKFAKKMKRKRQLRAGDKLASISTKYRAYNLAEYLFVRLSLFLSSGFVLLGVCAVCSWAFVVELLCSLKTPEKPKDSYAGALHEILRQIKLALRGYADEWYAALDHLYGLAIIATRFVFTVLPLAALRVLGGDQKLAHAPREHGRAHALPREARQLARVLRRARAVGEALGVARRAPPVSYTHLTLPTILLV